MLPPDFIFLNTTVRRNPAIVKTDIEMNYVFWLQIYEYFLNNQILEQRKQRKVYFSSAESRQRSMKSKKRPVFYSSKKSGPAPRGVKQALDWLSDLMSPCDTMWLPTEKVGVGASLKEQ